MRPYRRRISPLFSQAVSLLLTTLIAIGGNAAVLGAQNAPATATEIQFSAPTYAVSEGADSVEITVTRTGDSAKAMTVNYATDKGTASDISDFIPSVGKLSFGPGETSKTFTISIIQDNQIEAGETVRLLLSQPTSGASLGGPRIALLIINDDDAAATNPIDDAQFFVRQHYLDFLNREPDPEGLDFWTQEITNCGTDQDCRELKRINVSTSFFLSIEFQNTGYLAYRFYKSSFTEGLERPEGLPRIDEILIDAQQIQRGVIVGQGSWEQQLEQNKVEFARRWVQRTEFLAQFPIDMPAGAFVDKLFANSEVTPPQAERDAAVAAFGAGGIEGRAAALRNVADSRSVYNKQYNPAFVLMQYFGYLRRSPDDLPDNDFAGYEFWLAKLNQFSDFGKDVRDDEGEALGRVRRAEMSKSFLVSSEYLARFGPQSVTITPATVQTGKTVTVNITGQFTSFIEKITRARFGDGVSVGGSPAGEFGPVKVIDKTHATAEVTVVGSAAQGLRSVTLETVVERMVVDGRFSVLAINPLVISADVDRTTGVSSTSFTFTGRVVESPSPIAQWRWTLSDGRELMGMSISVSFPAPGLYEAQLMATDQEGNVQRAETGVLVFDPATQCAT